ncbi:MAG: hypothetical protein WCL21_16965 [Mariniphaga sp.]
MKKLLMVFIIVMSCTAINAQEIYEINGYLKQMKTSADVGIISDALHLESLVRDFQPTIYVGKSIVAHNEKQPVCAEAKSGSIDGLSAENPLFSRVELITIRLQNASDMNFVLDLSKLISFTNLKYVCLLCEFNCGIEDVRKLFIPKTGVIFIYKVSIPS